LAEHVGSSEHVHDLPDCSATGSLLCLWAGVESDDDDDDEEVLRPPSLRPLAVDAADEADETEADRRRFCSIICSGPVFGGVSGRQALQL